MFADIIARTGHTLTPIHGVVNSREPAFGGVRLPLVIQGKFCFERTLPV